MPQLASAATQHLAERPTEVQYIDSPSDLNDDPLGDIFDSEVERSSALKGNGIVSEEEIEQLLKGNWLSEAAKSVFDSPDSDYKTAEKKSKRLKESRDEDYLDIPEYTEDQHFRTHPRVMNSSGMALPDE